MRSKDGSGGEYPCKSMWYGKMAGRTIEEIIDQKPDYFIWMVESFLDVTPKQAEYFKEKYGMELPGNVVHDVIPYEHKKDSPEGEYEEICRRYLEEFNPLI